MIIIKDRNNIIKPYELCHEVEECVEKIIQNNEKLISFYKNKKLEVFIKCEKIEGDIILYDIIDSIAIEHILEIYANCYSKGGRLYLDTNEYELSIQTNNTSYPEDGEVIYSVYVDKDEMYFSIDFDL